MNEETVELENSGIGPCLALYHATAKNTGAAMQMWLHPAVRGQPGYISLKLAQQKGPEQFDWWNSVYVKLYLPDLAKLQMVFTRQIERNGNDGAGMNNTIRHTLDNGSVITVDLWHKVDPYPAYSLAVVKILPKSNAEQVQITLSNAEALAISEAIRGAMHYDAFGVPRLVKTEEE